MRLVDHRWIRRDIIGGNPALDLVNTVSGWDEDPEDWIPDVAGFLAWARTSGVLGTRENGEAVRLADTSPVAAERILSSMKELRLVLRHLVTFLEHRKHAKRKDLSVINEWARRLALSEEVTVRGNKIGFAIKRNISVLELPGLRVTAAALSLLTEPPPARIKTCPAHNCGWKFVDQSKNRSRRWCDMAVCGNLAKSRQFRARNG